MIQLCVPSQKTINNCLQIRQFMNDEDCVNPSMTDINDITDFPDDQSDPVKAYVELMPFHKAIADQYMQQEAQFAIWIAMIQQKKIDMQKMQKRPGNAILNIFKRHKNHDVEIQDLDNYEAIIFSFSMFNGKLKNLPKEQPLTTLNHALILYCDPLDIFTECTMRNFLLYILENHYYKEFGVQLDYKDKLNELKEKGWA